MTRVLPQVHPTPEMPTDYETALQLMRWALYSKDLEYKERVSRLFDAWTGWDDLSLPQLDNLSATLTDVNHYLIDHRERQANTSSLTLEP